MIIVYCLCSCCHYYELVKLIKAGKAQVSTLSYNLLAAQTVTTSVILFIRVVLQLLMYSVEKFIFHIVSLALYNSL